MNANTIEIHDYIKDNSLLISLVPPANVKSRTNSNICCVVDVSGSMANTATIKKTSTNSSSNENYDLSVLDLVKHALKMIVNCLTADDFFSVVVFSCTSKILFDLLPMNDGNKSQAIEKIETLIADGGTQLWSGLKQGLQVLQNCENINNNSSLFLLTDGQPSDSNIELNLKKFKADNKVLKTTINCFGFSNNCDSDLLDRISKEQKGLYQFIEDGSMIGTAFANGISNTLTTFSNSVLLSITTKDKSIKLQVPSSLKVISNTINKQGNNQIVIDLNVIHTQQSKDIVFNIKNIPELNKPYADVEIIYSQNYLALEHVKFTPNPVIVKKTLISSEETNDNKIYNHIYRFKMIKIIQESIDMYLKNPLKHEKQVKDNLFGLIEEMEEMLPENDRHFEGIYKDLVRTVSEGFTSQELFKSWGHHYLLSLMNAHLKQQCNNYKDPGVQHYGQQLFKEIREIADQTFCQMPPPKPYSQSQYYNNNSSNNNNSSSYTAAYNMNDYHNYSSGGCIHGDSIVYLANGEKKKVSEIKKGDLVLCPALGQNMVSKVECIVISKCQEGVHEFVKLGEDLWITKKHPIRINNEWVYPKSVGEIITLPSEYIYQFVLNSGHTLNIGGYEVICLGHQFTDNIAYHPYLGTNQVIQDLSIMKGWKEGKVLISGRLRNPDNSQVTAFIQ